MITKIILTLTILTLATTNSYLNLKYKNVLQGSDELTERVAQEIYGHFRSTNFEKSDYRFKIFAENLRQIKLHNAGGNTWTQGINNFADMTFQEFK